MILNKDIIMLKKALYRRITSKGIGPGGWKCSCCAPAPGKAKKLWMKIKKKELNKFFTDLINEEINDLN